MAADANLNDEQFQRNIPTHAMFGGSGRVRVLDYHGNGYFNVLTRDDRRVLAHRDNLTFVKPKRRQ